VRQFDIKFLKPLLLREKFISKDDKLLSTFKKITETNATKMAEKPDFILTTTSNLERLKKETFTTGANHSNGLNVVQLLICTLFYR
jgi:hypothetical protein